MTTTVKRQHDTVADEDEALFDHIFDNWNDIKKCPVDRLPSASPPPSSSLLLFIVPVVKSEDGKSPIVHVKPEVDPVSISGPLPQLPSPSPSLVYTKERRMYLAKVLEFYQMFIKTFNSPIQHVVHMCTGHCKFYHLGDFYGCLATGNVHQCTLEACDQTVITDEARVCTLTAIAYPLERKWLDIDTFNGITGVQVDNPKRTAWKLSDDHEQPTNVMMHPVIKEAIVNAPPPPPKRQRKVRVKSYTETEAAVPRYRAKKALPSSSAILKIKAERKKSQPVTDSKNCQLSLPLPSLLEPPPPPMTTTTVVTKYLTHESENKSIVTIVNVAELERRGTKRKKHEVLVTSIRPKKMINSHAQRAQAWSVARSILKSNCCNDPKHIDKVAKHCCDVWASITRTMSYQLKACNNSYNFTLHCYVVMDQMTTGLRSRGHKFIPQSDCLYRCMPRRSVFATVCPEIGTLTEPCKRFKHFASEIPDSDLVVLAHNALMRMGGIHIDLAAKKKQKSAEAA